MAYRFLKRESLQDGARRIVREELDTIINALGAMLPHAALPDAEAVHTARKGLKRLRSLLRLIRKQIGRESFLRESACFRDAARLLSSTRDADVRLATFDGLKKLHGDPLPKGVAAIRRALADDVAATRDRGRLDLKGLREMILDLEGARNRLSTLTLQEGWKVLRPGLNRSDRRAQKSFRVIARDQFGIDALHTCRKRFKDLHYQISLLHALPFPALRKIERQTKKMGELLGEDRDLGLLCANLQNRVIANVPPEVILQVCGRITRRQKTLQRKVSELGDKIVDTMLDIFPKAIGKCLKSWRGKNAAAAAP